MASGASYLTGKNLLRRAKRGLYAGRMILFGNKISEDGGNRCSCHCKSGRQRWAPASHTSWRLTGSHSNHGVSILASPVSNQLGT